MLDSLTENECIICPVDYQEIERKNPYLSQVERDTTIRVKFATAFVEDSLLKAYRITMSKKQRVLHLLPYSLRRFILRCFEK